MIGSFSNNTIQLYDRAPLVAVSIIIIIIMIIMIMIIIIVRIYTASIHSQSPKMCIFFHNLFHVSASHEVRHLVLPQLLHSSPSPPTRLVSTGKSSLANDYHPL